ncbi:MAG: BatD [Labilithrix sp.]|nr:BatD [Labilithrix sp.]
MSRSALVVFRAVSTLAAFLVALLSSRAAHAQRVDISANVDNDTVEIGETITYTFQVMSHGPATPSDPKPGAIPGFSLRGVSSAPVHMRMSVNGSNEEVNGLTTQWTLHADKLGSFTLGPAQITLGSARRSAAPVRVRVVERGQGGGRARTRPPNVDPFGSSSLDPFKGLFDFGDDDRRQEVIPPNADPKLALDQPRAPVAFLHATVDKNVAVVGEQVTLNVYLYEDPYARQGRPADVHEANANEFLKRSLLEDETRAVGVGTAVVGGKVWNVKLVRKNALFPLKTGHLAIEPMSMSLTQARVGLRESETLYVDVQEPPVAGRPAGYAIGDVGDMSLQATVTPRAIARDGAVGVNIELRGTGNLPGQLSLPVVPGVEWLEPTTRDKLGQMQNDRFGGTRTFSYVVRVHKEGAVDLGEVRLPYYDADKRAYSVARATLGIVNVASGPARDAGADTPEVVLGGMPKERRVLEGPHAQSYLAERSFYWVALFGSPLACAFALGAHGLLGRWREKRANAAPSAERIAKTRRAEADDACRGDDGKAAIGAIARAIEADVLAKTGVNLRGADTSTLKSELEAAGVTSARAKGVLAILRECEDARFSPDGVSIETARETWTRARALLDEASA